jgi:hypothetical protein
VLYGLFILVHAVSETTVKNWHKKLLKHGRKLFISYISAARSKSNRLNRLIHCSCAYTLHANSLHRSWSIVMVELFLSVIIYSWHKKLLKHGRKLFISYISAARSKSNRLNRLIHCSCAYTLHVNSLHRSWSIVMVKLFLSVIIYSIDR